MLYACKTEITRVGVLLLCPLNIIFQFTFFIFLKLIVNCYKFNMYISLKYFCLAMHVVSC